MKNKFTLLAGPCVIENEEMIFELAEKIQKITSQLDIDYYFKASFDKANRTSIHSFRGVGMEEGISILQKVKEKYNLKIVTDIHEPYQAQLVSPVADIIQIPAFLCRQTDLLIAAANTQKIINVKKAQFLAPWDMKNVVTKLEESGNSNIMLTERGTSFGYNTLVVDMTSIVEMKKFGYPVLFDATHSVQKPGGKGDATGGNREYVPTLAHSAIVAGADGLFVEVHQNPEEAKSDGSNMVYLEKLEPLLHKALKLYHLDL